MLGGFFSGLVLTVKLKKMSVFKFMPSYLVLLIHRALRIMPAYAIAIFFYFQILPFIGNPIQNMD